MHFISIALLYDTITLVLVEYVFIEVTKEFQKKPLIPVRFVCFG